MKCVGYVLISFVFSNSLQTSFSSIHMEVIRKYLQPNLVNPDAFVPENFCTDCA